MALERTNFPFFHNGCYLLGSFYFAIITDIKLFNLNKLDFEQTRCLISFQKLIFEDFCTADATTRRHKIPQTEKGTVMK